jgi:hypothetical protein
VVRPTPSRHRRAPGAPPPMRAPTPLPLIFPLPRSNLPLPLFHLPPPSLALGGMLVRGCRRSSSPEVSFLSPLFSPSSPSLSLRSRPQRSCAAPGAALSAALTAPGAIGVGAARAWWSSHGAQRGPRAGGARTGGAAPPPPPPDTAPVAWPTLAWPAPACGPAARPRRGSRPRGARTSVPGVRSPNPLHATLVRLVFKFTFKYSLIHVLRRALRRATIHFKFRFISVLRCGLRRATIHFNFSLRNVLHCALRRATFIFKFSLISVCHRALRRATFRVNFRFNSSVSLRALSRDDSF